jgi:mRNA interferase MazF
VRRGDVFTVSTRGLAAKPRPGVIIQATTLIREEHPVLVCPLSSEPVPVSIIRPLIEPSVANGLRAVSQAMVDRITGAMPREIGTVIGTLDENDMHLIDLALLTVLGLGPVPLNFLNFRESP